jgi:hypothetical protein
VDKVVTVPGYGEVATDGRSGGMAFAALDYWFAGLPVPSHRPEDFPDRAVPEDGTRLADFIHKRLFDSFATWSARHFLTWTPAEDHPTWSSPGVARLTGEELPRVRRSLDAGRPVVLGLVGARTLDEMARNRQVVAYGYDDDGGAGPDGGPPTRLFVYDSHHPDTEVVLGFEPRGRHWEASAEGGPWRGLFVQDYARERSPYIDLGAAKGIWVNSGRRALGGNLVAQFTARTTATTGPTCRSCAWPCAARPARSSTGSWAATATPLEPGEERAVFKASDGFGTVPGSYAVAAGDLSEQGCWLTIPPGEPGAVDEVGVNVIPPPRRDRVTVTFTAVTVEDAGALGGRLALRLAVGDQAAPLARGGAADVQDGKRFELDHRVDQVLNPSSVLEVVVTGETGAGIPAGVVREPYLGLDGWGGRRPRLPQPPRPGRHRPGPGPSPPPRPGRRRRPLDRRVHRRGDPAGRLTPLFEVTRWTPDPLTVAHGPASLLGRVGLTGWGVDRRRHPIRRWATLPHRGTRRLGRGVEAAPGGPDGPGGP